MYFPHWLTIKTGLPIARWDEIRQNHQTEIQMRRGGVERDASQPLENKFHQSIDKATGHIAKHRLIDMGYFKHNILLVIFLSYSAKNFVINIKPE